MNEEKQSTKAKNDVLKRVLIILIGLIVICLIFGAGMFVGEMKTRFSCQWAENYHKNFAGPKKGFFNEWRNMLPSPENFVQGHGIIGEIIEIKDNGFVIKGIDEMEKLVITSKDTLIKKGTETIQDSLEVGQLVVIIGSPNSEGQIEAKLIRLIDKKDEKPSNFPQGPGPKMFRF